MKPGINKASSLPMNVESDLVQWELHLVEQQMTQVIFAVGSLNGCSKNAAHRRTPESNLSFCMMDWETHDILFQQTACGYKYCSEQSCLKVLDNFSSFDNFKIFSLTVP